MKRREFLNLGVSFSAVVVSVRALLTNSSAWAADDKKAATPSGKDPVKATVSEKEILKEGQPATIANYCESPDKQPNKFCPDWKTKPGHCKDCTFYNKDNSEATHKGKKYARCQLLTDPKKPQFVTENGWCANYVKKT